MRRGSRRQDWTLGEIRFLKANAGRIPKEEIQRTLGRSAKAVDHMASRLGLSLRFCASSLVWCPRCATWRTALNARTGDCPVCAKREQLLRGERRISQSLKRLDEAQRAAYLSQETRRGPRSIPSKPARKQGHHRQSAYQAAKAEEAYLVEIEKWEVRCLEMRINADKKRLERIRAKSGDNPRRKK